MGGKDSAHHNALQLRLFGGYYAERRSAGLMGMRAAVLGALRRAWDVQVVRAFEKAGVDELGGLQSVPSCTTTSRTRVEGNDAKVRW
jgi:hypothetical protein